MKRPPQPPTIIAARELFRFNEYTKRIINSRRKTAPTMSGGKTKTKCFNSVLYIICIRSYYRLESILQFDFAQDLHRLQRNRHELLVAPKWADPGSVADPPRKNKLRQLQSSTCYLGAHVIVAGLSLRVGELFLHPRVAPFIDLLLTLSACPPSPENLNQAFWPSDGGKGGAARWTIDRVHKLSRFPKPPLGMRDVQPPFS